MSSQTAFRILIILTVFILIMISLLTIYVVSGEAAGPPEIVPVYLKANQTADITAAFCDRFIVEQISKNHIQVTCRVWMSRSIR